MSGTQPIASGATPPSFTQSYPSEQSVTINSALINKLNQRLQSRGSDLRLSFNDLTWANISIALYGTAAFASQLAAMNGGGSGPSVNEPDWVTDFMCAIDDDYCWETYAEASIRVPSNQNLDQFLSQQPAQPSQPAQPAQPPVIAPPVQPPPPPVQPPVQPPVHTPDATSDVTPPPPPAPKLKNISVNGEQATITVQNLNLSEEGTQIEISSQEGSNIFFENAELAVTADNRFTVPIDTGSAYVGTWTVRVTIHKADGTTVNLNTHLNIQAPAEE